ncbi:carboxypeptidase regulatory-like domain-containing protein [Paraburkholderia sp. J10-1]|uniref:carboxypeptidase regulatory-like domain-containing protein n=1 Tax=Paraburkholderia sp. J10-1 TaxID=2805430 RepID=UPI002AB6D7D9|nr:carboxypeptidase regulatory-like domain-containing protein [Paraburkholderia sp. J10-1]
MKLACEIIVTVALVAATSPGPNYCAAQSAPAETEAAATRTVQNGVAYITGGVGSDEAAAVRSVAGQYSLRMSFLTQGGQFLSDVDVEIIGPSGASVLKTRTLGPFLYVSLPAGRYQVTAYAAGTRQTRVVLVNARQGTNVQFDFPTLVRRAAASCCQVGPVRE